MKAIKNYSVELKSRSHYYDLEARVNYTCQTAKAMKEHFKSHKNISGGYESLCRCIDNLCKWGQNTGWFADGGEQVRVVYMGETIVTPEQTEAIKSFVNGNTTAIEVAKVFSRDEDCVSEILADFMDDMSEAEEDEKTELIKKCATEIVEVRY